MIQPDQEKVHQIFETISERYDLTNEIISLFQHKAWRKDTLRKMQVKRGAKALDLCCGTGDWTLLLAKKVGPHGKVYGMDFSKRMLERANEKIERWGLNNVTLLDGNVKNIPFQDNHFDYVTIGFGLRNVLNYVEVLKEIYRVLKDGGKMACLETSRPDMPVYSHLCFIYMRYVMPILGSLLTGRYKDYLWLQQSTWAFPRKEELANTLKEVGFENVQVKGYLGGITAMYMGTKGPKKETGYTSHKTAINKD